jgi:hypothetical protein
MAMTDNKLLIRAGGGRGFIVETKTGLCPYPKRLVVTAAHCLPKVPKPPGLRGNWDETLPNVLGPLGCKKPTVWAECLFVDPIADVAVLGEPDNQELFDKAMAYEELTEAVTPLVLGGAFARETKASVSMITLDGRTLVCTAEHLGDRLWLENTSEPFDGGLPRTGYEAWTQQVPDDLKAIVELGGEPKLPPCPCDEDGERYDPEDIEPYGNACAKQREDAFSCWDRAIRAREKLVILLENKRSEGRFSSVDDA